jgi:hypothetical protein
MYIRRSDSLRHLYGCIASTNIEASHRPYPRHPRSYQLMMMAEKQAQPGRYLVVVAMHVVISASPLHRWQVERAVSAGAVGYWIRGLRGLGGSVVSTSSHWRCEVRGDERRAPF